MNAPQPARPLAPRRFLFALLTLAAVALSVLIATGAGHYVLHVGATPAHDWTIDLLVSLVIAALGVVVGLWLTLWSAVTALCVLAATLGHRLHGFERLVAERGPALLRRLVVAAIGVGLSVTAAPAMAADSESGPGPNASASLGWQNSAPHTEPPVPEQRARTVAAPQATPEEPASVTVQPGDSLWAIAAAHLHEQAEPQEQVSNAAIAAAWPAWFELNENQIGTDPNLIRPGQQLQIPASEA